VLRWLVLAYLPVNCALLVADTWIEDSWFSWLNAPFGFVFWHLLPCEILKASPLQRDRKQFTIFSTWYLLREFVPSPELVQAQDANQLRC
jgi:hypothetical protein